MSRYEKAEKLLKQYPYLDGAIKRCEMEIAEIQEKKVNISTNAWEDRIQDSYQDKKGELLDAIEQREKRIQKLIAKKVYIESMLDQLNKEQRAIVEEAYFKMNGKGRLELCLDLNIGRSTLYRYEQRALETINKLTQERTENE